MKNTILKQDNNHIIEVEHLCKKYGDFIAVDDISFKVKRGGLFAFLGLNGAGKSTTINILTSTLLKTSGKVTIDGLDLDDDVELIKPKIGIVFQNSVLDSSLSGKENLYIRAGYYGIKGNQFKEREQILIDMLELKDFYNKPIGKLSGGQRRRIDIARAMVHDPKLLILDEPTTGLDPQTRVSVWNLINTLREKIGMTVFLTTHYMEEAEKATFVEILNHGKIIAEGTPTELKNQYSGDYVFIYKKEDKNFTSLLNERKINYFYDDDLKKYQVIVKDAADAINFIEQYKEYINDFEVKKGSMDDVFINVTGERKILKDKENEEK